MDKLYIYSLWCKVRFWALKIRLDILFLLKTDTTCPLGLHCSFILMALISLFAQFHSIHTVLLTLIALYIPSDNTLVPLCLNCSFFGLLYFSHCSFCSHCRYILLALWFPSDHTVLFLLTL